tara:strand:+ start:387 stop:1196 length:810 start_codon:yes stop_codon:yes gene_type:complete
MLKNFYLENKFALITGAGGLLGYEHAAALLETGANVILTDINIKNLNKNYNKLTNIYKGKIIIKKSMDVTNEKSIFSCFNFLKKKKILVQILVNNASFNPQPSQLKSSQIEKFEKKRWTSEIDCGLTGAFLCSKIFGSSMANSNKGGVILNIASDLSVISPDNRIYNQGKIIKNVKPITYSVIKTGMIGMTRYLATYWSDKKIRCNALSPGGVENFQNKKFVKKIKDLIPMSRMAKKNEYRSAVQFLCSDASSYMTGQNIVIDGGRSVW